MKKAVVLFLMVTGTFISGVFAQKVVPASSVEISQLLAGNKSIVVLDVRTPQEFAAGHLKGALNIDIYQQDFYSRIDKLNKKSTYVVYCRTHNRSTATVNYMKQNGFALVYQMMDGFPGWAGNKLPYEK